MGRFGFAAFAMGIATVGLVGCQKAPDTAPKEAGASAPTLSSPVLANQQSFSSKPSSSIAERAFDSSYRIMPRSDKADATVFGSYKTEEGNSAEVVGVCKVSEETVSCFNRNGEPMKALTAEIKARFTGNQITLLHGRKDRLVVFKVTQPVKKHLESGLALYKVGSSESDNRLFFLGDQRRRVGETLVSYPVWFIAEKSTASSTTARFHAFQRVDDPATLHAKVGASAAFGGQTFTVTSIKDVGSRPIAGLSAVISVPAWTVTVKEEAKARPIWINLEPLDASGKPILYVDAKGEPISAKQYEEEMERFRARRIEMRKAGKTATEIDRVRPKVRSIKDLSGRRWGRDGSIEFEFYVNPKQVARYSINGGFSEVIDIAGIPLDPR